MASLAERVFAQPPHQPPYVLEDVERRPPRKLFSLLGVKWLGTPVWWVAPLWIVGLGLLISFLLTPAHEGEEGTHWLWVCRVTGLSILMHQVGQVLAGRMVGAPMKAVVFTSTLAYHPYADPHEYPSRVHLIRALGGPGANLLIGLRSYVLNDTQLEYDLLST